MTEDIVSLKNGKPVRKVIGSEELFEFLYDKKIRLDCGHWATPGHNLSNTIIIHSEGGGKIKTECHNCGY